MTSYAAAGVDIEAGDRAVELMKASVKRTNRPEVLGGLGGFAGLFALDLARYPQPVLASSTDGVGTKIAIAQALDRHDTIGIDLVAMVVDDLVVVGAEPLFLTDYIATGQVVPEKIAAIVSGIAEGCVQAGCALVGGETAEHPGVMAVDEYDVSGTGVGRGQCRCGARRGPVARRRRPDRAGVVRPALQRVLARPARVVGPGRTGPGDQRLRRSDAGRRTAHTDHASTPRTAWRWPAIAVRADSRTSPVAGWPATSRACCRATSMRSSTGRRGRRNRSSTWSRRRAMWGAPSWSSTFNLGVGMIAVVPDERAALALLAARGVPAWTLGALRPGTGQVELVDDYQGPAAHWAR